MEQPALLKERSDKIKRSETLQFTNFETMVHNKTFKLPSKDEISFLHPGSYKKQWEMVIRKHDSHPVKNNEFGHFERKTAKVSQPPQSEPFSDVYESEIEVREDAGMLDDS